jgi:hypothetical protein
MVLPLEDNSLEQISLRIMSERPYVTAEKLRVLASTSKRKFSPAAVYKVLSKLLTSGVVVKAGTNYSLSLTWVFGIFSFAEKLSKAYFCDEYLDSLLPESGKRRSWKFNDLRRCNDFWNQLLLALLKRTPNVDSYAWVPSPWFVLLPEDRDSRIQQVFRMTNRKFYSAFGASPRFEPIVRKLYNHKNQILAFGKKPFAAKDARYLDVVGDFVLTVSVEKKIGHEISLLFADNKRSELNTSRALAILCQRCRTTISIEHSPRKAARMRKTLAKLFSLDDSD